MTPRQVASNSFVWIAEKLGIPTAILVALGGAILHFGNRTLNEVVIPVSQRHIKLIDKLVESSGVTARAQEVTSETLKSMDMNLRQQNENTRNIQKLFEHQKETDKTNTTLQEAISGGVTAPEQ